MSSTSIKQRGTHTALSHNTNPFSPPKKGGESFDYSPFPKNSACINCLHSKKERNPAQEAALKTGA